MTVETNDTYERYVISGVGPYAFSWRIFSDGDLVVTALAPGDVDPVIFTTEYSVTGVNDIDGGSITLTAGAATTYAGYTLDIRSDTPIEQPTSIKNQGTFLPVVHETAFDRLNRQIQDLARKVKQSFRYPDDVALDAVMQARTSWLERYLYVNASGIIEPAVALANTLTQSIFNAFYILTDDHKRTDAEIAASVTPVSYAYDVTPYQEAFRHMSDAQRTSVLAGDMTQDVTTPLNNLFKLSGLIAHLPKGTYKVTANLTKPACSGIIGDGDSQTIISCSGQAAVTKLLSLGSATKIHRDYQILGNTTASAQGIVFGDGENMGIDLSNVRVKGFTGTSAQGAKFSQPLKSTLVNFTTEGNYDNIVIDSSGAGGLLPTTLVFIGGVSTGATNYGLKGLTGEGVYFLGMDFESCTKEGVILVPPASGILKNWTFMQCWFEANYSAGNFMATADGSGASSTLMAAFRSCNFRTSGGTAKALQVTGAVGQTNAYVSVSDPIFASVLANNITAQQYAGGIWFSDWNHAYDYAGVVSDAYGHCIGVDGVQLSYTPTLSVPSGSIGSTSITNARYRRIGNKLVHMQFAIGGTITGTPAYISVSLPVASWNGLNSSYGGPARITSNSVIGAGNWLSDGAGNLLFSPNGNFAAGPAAIIADLTLEIQ